MNNYHFSTFGYNNDYLLDNKKGTDENVQTIIDKQITPLEKIIDKKLSELKPRHVKKIIEDMIRQHLGWLVVWGGVFGGVFGLCFGLTNYFKIL